MIRNSISWLICGLAVLVFLPASSTAMTLSEALVRAYQTNPALEGERARVRATDEGVPQASSNWRPTISVSGSYGLKRSNSTSNGPSNKSADVTQPATGSLTITQDIYRGGRTFAAREKAEHDIRADRARLSATEQDVLLNTATGYANVVRDQAVLDLNRNNEVVLWRQLEASQDRFRVGDITLTDVSQAESRLSQAQAERIAAKGRLSVSHASLENMVGTAPQKLQPANPLGDLPGTLEIAIEHAKKTNFLVVRAGFLERSARTNVRTISGELLPTVTVNGSFTANDETTKDRSQSETLSVTAKVSIPLYSSGSVRSRIRAAKQVVSQRRDEFSQAVRDTIESTTAAWQTVQTSRAQIRAFEQAVRAAKIALEGLQEEAKVGSRTILDVMDAEQELLDVRVGLVGSKRDELIATFQLRHALGELTAQKLRLPVDIYNVETHYRDVRNKWWGLNTGQKDN